MSDDTPNTATLIEIHAVVTLGPDLETPTETLAEVSALAWELRAKLPKGSQFSIQTRDVPLQVANRRVQA